VPDGIGIDPEFFHFFSRAFIILGRRGCG
jgi:hypothetical protein